MTVRIITEQGSHLLVADNERYAVIERREDHFYNCHDASRAGVPMGDLSAVRRVLDEQDWTDRQTAQATFDAVIARGSQLAQRML